MTPRVYGRPATGFRPRPLPPKLTLTVLGAQPEESLGHDFYRLIVDNDFHLEVLDRERVTVASASPSAPPATCTRCSSTSTS